MPATSTDPAVIAHARWRAAHDEWKAALAANPNEKHQDKIEATLGEAEQSTMLAFSKIKPSSIEGIRLHLEFLQGTYSAGGHWANNADKESFKSALDGLKGARMTTEKTDKEHFFWEKWHQAEEAINDLQGLIYALDELTTEAAVFNRDVDTSPAGQRHRAEQSHAIIALCRLLHARAVEYDAERASQ